MAEQQDQNQTEKATPFKLQEARKRGQVAKSIEANSLLLLFAALVISYFAGEHFVDGMLAISRALLANAHLFPLEPALAIFWFEQTFSYLINLFWMFVFVIVITSILANLLQTGPVLSFFPLKPDFQRINPVSGFKRLFSMKLIYESIKTFIKIAVFGFVIYSVVSAALPQLLALLDITPASYPLLLMQFGRGLVYKLLLVLFLIVMIDLVYTRWEFAKKMRMSHRDIKQEHKRREGDPQIKARLRELQREAVKRAGAIQKVPEADVLITNPTRLAIALLYDQKSMLAPQVIAKSAGEMAAKMREVARKNSIPIVENKRLAKALFRRVDIDDKVPEDLFPVVAKILVWVMMQRSNQPVAVV